MEAAWPPPCVPGNPAWVFLWETRPFVPGVKPVAALGAPWGEVSVLSLAVRAVRGPAEPLGG